MGCSDRSYNIEGYYPNLSVFVKKNRHHKNFWNKLKSYIIE